MEVKLLIYKERSVERCVYLCFLGFQKAFRLDTMNYITNTRKRKVNTYNLGIIKNFLHRQQTEKVIVYGQLSEDMQI